MTSTTSSNNRFSLLYKWAIRRNKPIIIVFSILMAVGILIDINGLTFTVAPDFSQEAVEDARSTIGLVSLIIAQIGAVVVSLISSLITFSFLHNKRSVDMYGSMPAKRETVFLSHLLGSMTAVGAPYIAGSLIVIGLTSSGESLGHFLMILLSGILGIAASCTFTALIAYCCGTSVDTLITAIGVNAIYAGTVGLYWMLMSNMIPGVNFENFLTSPFIVLLCPYAFCFFADAYHIADENTSFAILIIWMIVFTAGVFALALLMSKRRKAETAQSGFAVGWIPQIIKAGASIVCGGLVGGIAGISSDAGISSMFQFVIWYIIVGAAAFAIIHIIIERGFKKGIRKGIIIYTCTTAVFLMSVLALTTGLGIDKYVPDPDNVRSARLNYDEPVTDPENIKTVTEIHRLIADGIHNSHLRPYYINNDSMYGNYSYYTESGDDDSSKMYYPLTRRCDFDFSYKKKIGFSTSREYYLYPDKYFATIYDFDSIEKLLQKYYSSDEYKRSQNAALWADDIPEWITVDKDSQPLLTYEKYRGITKIGDDDGYYGSNYFIVKEETLPYNKKFLSGLYVALRKDILADKEYYTQILDPDNTDNDALYGDGYIRLDVNYKYSEYDVYRGNIFYDHNEYADYASGVHVVIKDSYSNTLKYLADHYIDTETTTAEESAAMYSMTAAGYMECLDRVDPEKTEGYIEFGFDGNIEDLLRAVDGASELMEGTALSRMGMFEEAEEWDNAHGKEFRSKLIKYAQYYYNDYPNPEAMPDYTNSFMDNMGISGDWFYMEDKIFEELDSRLNEIVSEINNAEASKKASDNTDSSSKASESAASDNSSKASESAASDTSSKASESAASDTSSKASESAAPDTSSKANESAASDTSSKAAESSIGEAA